MVEEDTTNIGCFGEDITGINAAAMKIVSWVRVLVKMVFLYIEN
jgi:hypothetical protein